MSYLVSQKRVGINIVIVHVDDFVVKNNNRIEVKTLKEIML